MSSSPPPPPPPPVKGLDTTTTTQPDATAQYIRTRCATRSPASHCWYVRSLQPKKALINLVEALGRLEGQSSVFAHLFQECSAVSNLLVCGGACGGCVTRHMSPRHTSHVTRHTSHVTFCRSAATLTTSPFAYIPYRVSFLINQSLNVKNVIKITQDVSLAAVRALDCSPPNDARVSRGAQSSISTSISAGVRDPPRDASLV